MGVPIERYVDRSTTDGGRPKAWRQLLFAGSGRVERSLYSRAVGYNYEATKIFMPAEREKLSDPERDRNFCPKCRCNNIKGSIRSST